MAPSFSLLLFAGLCFHSNDLFQNVEVRYVLNWWYIILAARDHSIKLIYNVLGNKW